MPTLFESPAPKKHNVKPMPSDAGRRSSMTPLTCFAVSPDGVRFETQQEDEEVILFLRQHLIVNVPWLIIATILLIAPSVLFPFALASLKLPVSIPTSYLIIGTVFWYLVTAGFIITNFLRWFFNIYIVTNERIVDIDFLHLLYKQFSEARLSKIQDIMYTSGGILATILNYGDVFVQTAGEAPNLEFLAVPYPDRVVQTISQLAEKMQEDGGTV